MYVKEKSQSLHQLFLTYVHENIFPAVNRGTWQPIVFEHRFNPKNKITPSEEIIEALAMKHDDFNSDSFGQSLKEVVGRIREHFQEELERDGVIGNLRGRQGGRRRGELAPWEHAYNWLWKVKYISWLEDYIWSQWKKAATPNGEWIDFSDGSKGLKIPTPEATPVLPKDTPLSVQINIDKPGSYLLLLNRGIKTTAEETQEEVLTKYLIAPSQGFAPNSKLTQARMLMPQEGSMAADNNMKFEFDAASTDEYFVLEEYVAILVDEELDLEWLKPNPTNPALEWDGSHLEQLWNQLQKQNTEIFHREFEVQDVRTLVA